MLRLPRRLALIALPFLAASALTAAPSSAATPRTADVSVSRGACTTSPIDPQGRSATFVVRMRRADATSYGFVPQLEQRVPGGVWTPLKGTEAPAGFSALKAARRGSSRMVRRINVRGLRAGSAYRLRVEGRWLRGTTARSASTVSRGCTVKDVRPDVALTGAFGWQPSTAGGEVAYRIGVGATDAQILGTTDVGIAVRQGETTLATGTFRPTVATGAVVLLPGKRCVQGQPVTVTLDPENLVDDRDPANDVLSAECVQVSR